LVWGVFATQKTSALSPIFASGAGIASATRKNGMLPINLRSPQRTGTNSDVSEN
jgi:hypothetical protein